MLSSLICIIHRTQIRAKKVYSTRKLARLAAKHLLSKRMETETILVRVTTSRLTFIWRRTRRSRTKWMTRASVTQIRPPAAPSMPRWAGLILWRRHNFNLTTRTAKNLVARVWTLISRLSLMICRKSQCSTIMTTTWATRPIPSKWRKRRRKRRWREPLIRKAPGTITPAPAAEQMRTTIARSFESVILENLRS